ncbi:hypothetical protein BO226_10005 [Rhodococcus sp. 2G]|nr:hypothetical protein BO226_10005 [Rhodococcus sp. 2G]
MVHLPVRLDPARGGRALRVDVVEGERVAPCDRLRDGAEQLRRHAGSLQRTRLHRAADGRDSRAQPRGQELVELAVGAGRGVVQSAFGRSGRSESAEPQQHRDGLVVVEHQRRHRASRREAIETAGPGTGFDGIPVAAQTVDIAAERPAAHLQPPGQFVPADRASGLQDRQQREHPLGDVRHAVILPPVAVRIRPQPVVASNP